MPCYNGMREFMKNDKHEQKQDENEKVEVGVKKNEHRSYQQYERDVQLDGDTPIRSLF